MHHEMIAKGMRLGLSEEGTSRSDPAGMELPL